MKKKQVIFEELYILGRKVKAFFSSIPFYICRIFPVHTNKIVMWTFEGMGGYGCSPKYIAEELLNRKAQGKNNFEIFWLLDDMDKSFPSEIKKVKNTLWARAYHLSTARFWVANTRTFYGTKKRKGTTYLQTWHGTIALKPIGKYRGKQLSKMAYIVSAHDSRLIDYLLAGSRWCAEMWPDGLIYDGKILKTGTPRCDVFFSGVEETHLRLRMEYNLSSDVKILLYAPTFRGGSQGTVRNVNAGVVSLDFCRLIRTLGQKFGGEWYVFLRLHPQLAGKMERMPVAEENNHLIDVSQRPDMNEIMAASDAIITDYSTVIFEGFLTGMPGFLYIDDLEAYVADRGNLMFDMGEIPFLLAHNNDELMNNILSFNFDTYKKDVAEFTKKTGIFEDGHASQRIVDLVENMAAENNGNIESRYEQNVNGDNRL